MTWMWIVLIIPVVVWILSSVIRSEEQSRLQRRPAPPRDGEGGSEPPRPRPPGEVERFLEEINRLRRRSAEQQQAAQEPTAAPPEIPRPAPRRPPRPVAPRRPRPEPVARPLPLSARPMSTLAPPAVVVPPPPPPPPSPIAPATAQFVDVIPAAASARAPVPSTAPSDDSPGAVLRDMLRTPSTRAAAVVLHEILGPPRCRRRRLGV